MAVFKPLTEWEKYCKHSPTIEESALQNAIVIAINKFMSVKDEVSDMLEQNIRQALNPNFSETIINAEKRIKEIQQLTMELVSACATHGDTEKYMEEFERFKNETDGLREFIKLEKLKVEQTENNNSKVDYILETLRNTDFEVKEYDDVIVRHLVEGIKVISKDEILIVFKGGFELRQKI